MLRQTVLFCLLLTLLAACDSPPVASSTPVTAVLTREEREMQFLQAISRNDQARMEQLLTQGIELEEQLSKGAGTPLQTAVAENQLLVVRWLLDRGARVGGTGVNGETPLHGARHYNIAQLLLDKGADPNVLSATGYSPLDRAVQSGHYALTQLLLKRGARPMKKNISPLFLTDQPGLQRLLIESGALPSSIDPEGSTVLHKSEDVDLAAYLLDKGLDPDVRSLHGHTALHLTASLEKFKLLLSRGANPHALNSNEEPPVISQAAAGRQHLVAYLLEKYPDIIRPQLGEALHQALKGRHTGLVSYLLKQGASPDQPQVRTDDSPLMSVLSAPYSQKVPVLMKLLLSHGAKPNQTNKLGETVLMRAAAQGVPEWITQLLEAGADPDLRDNQGRTAIHLVLNAYLKREIYLECLQALLAGNANPNLKDRSLTSPLLLATSQDNPKAVKMLLESGKFENPEVQIQSALLYIRRQLRLGQIISGETTRALEQALERAQSVRESEGKSDESEAQETAASVLD